MKHKIAQKTPLKVLYLEDSPHDIEIIRELLKDAGYDLSMDCADKKKEYVSLLGEHTYDVILSDFTLPGFNAFGALDLAKKICPEVPFICVSGSIGEETAIELIKQGAVDYVLKDRMVRLPLGIKRALDEAKERKSRRQSRRGIARKRRTVPPPVQLQYGWHSPHIPDRRNLFCKSCHVQHGPPFGGRNLFARS